MSRPYLLGLWLSYLVFIVYGSLVPLEYRPMPLDQAWAAFQHIPFLNLGIESRADWVANGVLYAPLGYFSANLLMRVDRSAWHIPAALASAGFCCAVAFAVEFTQLFFPLRTVSQNDLYAECIGSMAGIVLAPLLLPWLKRLAAHWSLGGQQLQLYLLQAYAAGYVMLCLFPYDFLLSRVELSAKIHSTSWGWILAGGSERPALVALRLAVEVALAIPVGFLVARRAGSGLLAGLLLGVAIEGAQFFIETAISQGLSVLTRGLGVCLGVAMWRRRDALGAEFWSGLIHRYRLVLLPVYLVALSVANGWTVRPWHGLPEAVSQWHAVRLMPFYYHYYTTEAHALASLGSVALMYMPLAVLVWAHRARLATLLLLSGVGSLLVEISKLFLTGSRPDPTNVLIAMVASAATLKLLEVVTRSVAPPTAGADDFSPRAAPDDELAKAGSRVGQYAAFGLVVGLAGLQAALFPAFAPALASLLLACAVAVWIWPPLALALIPAALPVFDLAPWSGRFYWDEFDLLVVVCLAVGFVRSRPSTRKSTPWDALGLSFLVLALSFGLSTLIALFPWQSVSADSFFTYTSQLNALRIVKGGLWAWCFFLLYSRLADLGEVRARVFSGGMQSGLALTVLFVLWERWTFANLFDFTTDYRVTGPISAMHKGGAYIECYLAVAAAFVIGQLLQARSWRARVYCSTLLIAATYCVMVTYSRNGYAALAVVAAVMLGGHLLGHAARSGRIAAVAGVVLLILAVAVPIAAGPYARARLGASGSDLAVRAAHWRDALALRDSDWTTDLFGVGIGRFPYMHLWRSNESTHAATYSIQEETGNQFLRLGTGATLYMEQLVNLESGRNYVVSARIRSNQPNAEVQVMLCEKWMLTSARCGTAVLKTSVPVNAWQDVQAPLSTAALGHQPWYARRPLKLALLSPVVKSTLDIDNVRLDAWPAPNSIENGNFSSGLDHWFFTTDVHPPWHIDSLPVAILFDQGWLGVVAWTLVCGLALVYGIGRARTGSMPALTAMAGLLGFVASGSLNTLIDAPRFLWLLLVLAWLCRGDEHRSPAAVPVGRRRRKRRMSQTHCRQTRA